MGDRGFHNRSMVDHPACAPRVSLECQGRAGAVVVKAKFYGRTLDFLQRSFNVVANACVLTAVNFAQAQLGYAWSRSRGEHGDIVPTPGDNPRRCSERARL